MGSIKKTDPGAQGCVATPPGFGAKQAWLIQREMARGRCTRSVHARAIDDTKVFGATTPTGSAEKGTSRRTRDEQAEEISAAVKALAEWLTEKDASKNHYQGIFAELYRRFGVTSYKPIRLE